MVRVRLADVLSLVPSGRTNCMTQYGSDLPFRSMAGRSAAFLTTTSRVPAAPRLPSIRNQPSMVCPASRLSSDTLTLPISSLLPKRSQSRMETVMQRSDDVIGRLNCSFHTGRNVLSFVVVLTDSDPTRHTQYGSEVPSTSAAEMPLAATTVNEMMPMPRSAHSRRNSSEARAMDGVGRSRHVKLASTRLSRKSCNGSDRNARRIPPTGPCVALPIVAAYLYGFRRSDVFPRPKRGYQAAPISAPAGDVRSSAFSGMNV
mmetsp:Transcript_42242/g.84948  ORF Transcript_42242/g.84948 Transcript_42242/m.84948 type:complete len:259 (-) Transcript_42242:14-790(-)